MSNHSPPVTARIYQTKKQMHDIAMTTNERNSISRNGTKLYICAGNNIAIPQEEANIITAPLGCDTFRVQLLIREKLAAINITTLSASVTECRITFTLEEYLTRLGYDDNAIQNSQIRQNWMRKLNKALKKLHMITYQINRGRDYCSFCIISALAKNGSQFTIRLTREYVALITQACKRRGPNLIPKLTQFSHALYKLKNFNDMVVMFYLETRYSMTSNQNKHIHNIIKIESLARSLCLPDTRGTARSIKHTTNYYRSMVEPVIKALNSLAEKGLIDYALYEDTHTDPVDQTRLSVLRQSPETFLNVRVVFNCHTLSALPAIPA